MLQAILKVSSRQPALGCLSIVALFMRKSIGAAWGISRAIVPIKTQPDVKLPVNVDGLMHFEMEDVLVEQNWDRILAAFAGVREGRWFHFLTKNPLQSPA
jgi:hypothetical protein